MLQHAIGQVFFEPAPHSSSALLARLPDIQSGGGRYEVDTVCTSNRLPYVRDGRDMAWYFSHRRSRQQIYAQSWPIALKRSQACVQKSSWHRRPWNSFLSEPNLWRSPLHRLELRRLRCREDPSLCADRETKPPGFWTRRIWCPHVQHKQDLSTKLKYKTYKRTN